MTLPAQLVLVSALVVILLTLAVRWGHPERKPPRVLDRFEP